MVYSSTSSTFFASCHTSYGTVRYSPYILLYSNHIVFWNLKGSSECFDCDSKPWLSDIFWKLT